MDSGSPTLTLLGVDLNNAPKGAAVLFHACAHNPTGVDPNVEQWKELSEICKKNELIPLFDTAYQGFASGDADADAFSVRHFVEEGHSVISTQSFSKNFGLYGDRTGCLSFTPIHHRRRLQLKVKSNSLFARCTPIHLLKRENSLSYFE